MKKTMFVLGSTGFVGAEVVKFALESNWIVKALVRSQEAFDKLSEAGATPILGDANDPLSWGSELKNADVLVDLIQPDLPSPLTLDAVKKVSEQRQALTKGVLAVLQSLKDDERPLFISVSGTDDLEPNSNGRISSSSSLKNSPRGFGHIGIPVRRLLDASGVAVTFVYLGTVYGPGKTFADVIVPKISQGKWKIIGNGSNHMPLVHVEDAARGLIHLAALDRKQTVGKTFVLADGSEVTNRELFNDMARMMNVKAPGRVPKWLASISAGKILIETMTRNLLDEPDGLIATGFVFKYPSYREGIPPTLEKLGYPKPSKKEITKAKSVSSFLILLLVTLGVIAAENFGNFRMSIPNLLRESGGLPILDMRFWYSADQAYQLFDRLGPIGRSDNQLLYMTVDIIIPLLAAMLLWSAMSRGALRKFRGVALLGGVFDYLENITILTLLVNYPIRLDHLVVAAASFTLLKFLSYFSSICLAIAGFSVSGFTSKRGSSAAVGEKP